MKKKLQPGDRFNAFQKKKQKVMKDSKKVPAKKAVQVLI